MFVFFFVLGGGAVFLGSSSLICKDKQGMAEKREPLLRAFIVKVSGNVPLFIMCLCVCDRSSVSVTDQKFRRRMSHVQWAVPLGKAVCSCSKGCI